MLETYKCGSLQLENFKLKGFVNKILERDMQRLILGKEFFLFRVLPSRHLLAQSQQQKH